MKYNKTGPLLSREIQLTRPRTDDGGPQNNVSDYRRRQTPRQPQDLVKLQKCKRIRPKSYTYARISGLF